MQASDVMTRNAVSVRPDSSVAAAVQLMVSMRISGLPVVDAQNHLVGIITEGDLMHRAETETGVRHRSRIMNFLLGYGGAAADYAVAHTRKVEDLMTTKLVSVPEDASLEDVVDLMERHHIRRVPVLRDGALVGIVSRHDLLRVLVRKLEAAQTGGTDAEIEARLRAELASQPWLAASDIGVTVQDRTVTLEGVIFDERIRKALLVAAENVAEGVTVEDHLIWCDPNSGTVLDPTQLALSADPTRN